MVFKVAFNFFTSLFIILIMSHYAITTILKYHIKLSQIKTTWEPPTDSNIAAILKKVGIIPYVVEDSPKQFLKVTFRRLFKNFHVQYQEPQLLYFDHITMKNKPSEIQYECDDLDLYTLFFTLINVTIPDLEGNKKVKSFNKLKYHNQIHHWIVYNIPGENWKDGTEFLTYRSPPPMYNEDECRVYVFLLFKQKKEFLLDVSHLKNETKENLTRTAFTVRDFIKKCDLEDSLQAVTFLRQKG